MMLILYKINKKKQWITFVPAGARIGHVHLKVADIERALAFYRIYGIPGDQWYGDSAVFIPPAVITTNWPQYLVQQGRGPGPRARRGSFSYRHFFIPTRRDLAIVLAGASRLLRHAKYPPMLGASAYMAYSEALSYNECPRLTVDVSGSTRAMGTRDGRAAGLSSTMARSRRVG